MHLVGFIIRIYHDALSPEWQMPAGLYRVELGLPTWRKPQPVSILEQVAALFCHAGESVAERNTGVQVKLHSEEVHSLCPPLNFVKHLPVPLS